MIFSLFVIYQYDIVKSGKGWRSGGGGDVGVYYNDGNGIISIVIIIIAKRK